MNAIINTYADCYDFLLFVNKVRYNYARETYPEVFFANKRIVLSNIHTAKTEDEIVINFNRVIKRGWEHFDNAVICALRMLSRMNAKNVFLAGFDGFKEQYNESYADADLPALNVSNKWEALNAEIRDMYSDVKLSVGEKIKIKFLTNSVFEL